MIKLNPKQNNSYQGGQKSITAQNLIRSQKLL